MVVGRHPFGGRFKPVEIHPFFTSVMGLVTGLRTTPVRKIFAEYFLPLLTPTAEAKSGD